MRSRISSSAPSVLDLEPASFGQRCLAALIDHTIILIVVLPPVGFVYSATHPKEVSGDSLAVALLISGVSAMSIYYWLCTGLRGRTVGKTMLRIRVVNHSGALPGWGRALWRETVGRVLMLGALCVSMLSYAISSMVAYSYDSNTMNTYPERGYRKPGDREPLDVLGFYDRLTGTRVVRRAREGR